jgi:hypothetical protein
MVFAYAVPYGYRDLLDDLKAVKEGLLSNTEDGKPEVRYLDRDDFL